MTPNSLVVTAYKRYMQALVGFTTYQLAKLTYYEIKDLTSINFNAGEYILSSKDKTVTTCRDCGKVTILDPYVVKITNLEFCIECGGLDIHFKTMKNV